VNRHNVATIATKDLRLLRSKRSVAVSIVAFPALVAVGLPLVVRFAGASHNTVQLGLHRCSLTVCLVLDG
jgi:hypothetical protein